MSELFLNLSRTGSINSIKIELFQLDQSVTDSKQNFKKVCSILEEF
ncbi:hypothetical protein LEP1GSC172_3437 [Leptospira noguchii]|uniref:Uncharacterized protein n=1 Tax=Leptospira noguchii TaxID=28182 RepID=M6VFU5_9LEPT|nr:hypothetical protein LEP1GSC172_3437 [Leptospira noguchii]